MGVGGVFAGGEEVETFSSDGPRRIFFEANGTPITPGDFSSTGGTVRPKPDLAGADGISTATPGFDPFFGTSAAARHAAAIAALMQDRAGGTLIVAQIRTAMTTTGKGMGKTRNQESGGKRQRGRKVKTRNKESGGKKQSARTRSRMPRPAGR